MEITAICEAFSSQPRKIIVGNRYDYYNEKSPIVDRIVSEIRGTPNTPLMEVYAGYDKSNNKIFEYLANSVNVEYGTTNNK